MPTSRKDTPSTRERLIEASAREFALRGYEGTSLRKIGAAVGIRAASIFKHFDSKRALYDAILARIMDSFTEGASMIIKAQDGGDAPSLLVELGTFYWDYCAENPSHAALMLREGFEPPSDRVAHVFLTHKILVDLARAFIERAQAEGELRPFDPDTFLLWMGGYCATFHGAAGFQRSLWTSIPDAAERRAHARVQFIEMVEHHIRAPREMKTAT